MSASAGGAGVLRRFFAAMADSMCILPRFWLPVPIFFCLLLSSCASADEGGPVDEFGIESRLSGDVREIRLSHTLDEVASGRVEVEVLRPDMTVGEGEGEVEFGAAVDIASLGGGAFAVFDRMEAAIVLFDDQGARGRTLGRRGEGPGEFVRPWALSVVDGKFVAGQNSASHALTIVDSAGATPITIPTTEAGDWSRPMFRGPMLGIDGFQQGPEDVTRRLAPYGEDGFIHQLQENEYRFLNEPPPFSTLAPPNYLIHYGLDLEVRDTVAILAGPPTFRTDEGNGPLPLFAQPLFAARPVWATGAGWIAIAHGDSTRASVQDLEDRTLATITWPAPRRSVTDDEKREAARWIIANQVRNSSASMEMFRAAGRREIAEGIRQTAFESTPTAELVPTVTAAYGAGACLFLAGHSATDWPDGTATTWVALNVRKGTLEGVFSLAMINDGEPLELDRQGRAVRAIDTSFIFTTHRDGYGTSIIQRFPLPPIDCSAP